MTEVTRPVLQSAVPLLMTDDLDASVRFFEGIGFRPRHNDGALAIINRDAVELHLGRLEGQAPSENMSECRVNVRHIEAFYEECKAVNAIHPNGSLKVQPWGLKEFAILDPRGICVKFAEPVS